MSGGASTFAAVGPSFLPDPARPRATDITEDGEAFKSITNLYTRADRISKIHDGYEAIFRYGECYHLIKFT